MITGPVVYGKSETVSGKAGRNTLRSDPYGVVTLHVKERFSLDVVRNIVKFLFFGIGLVFPLLAFALISAAASQAIIGFLTIRRRVINLAAGAIMLPVSVYYLVFVSKIFGE